MAYRTTPLENGYSTAELLMGRKVRTTVHITKSNLLPCTINMSQLSKSNNWKRESAGKLWWPPWSQRLGTAEGESTNMDISDTGAEGRVIQGIQTNPPRSYMVETPTGTYRRNRRSLTALPLGDPSKSFDRSSAGDHQDQCTTRLRSGRVTKPPGRLDLASIITLLGIEIDTARGLLRLSGEKLQRIRRMLSAWMALQARVHEERITDGHWHTATRSNSYKARQDHSAVPDRSAWLQFQKSCAFTSA